MHRHCARCWVAMVNKTQSLFSSRSIWATPCMRDNCFFQSLWKVSKSLPQVSSCFQTHNWSLYSRWKHIFLWGIASHEVLKTILVLTGLSLPERMNNESVAQQALVWEEEMKDNLDYSKRAFGGKVLQSLSGNTKGRMSLDWLYVLKLFFQANFYFYTRKYSPRRGT